MIKRSAPASWGPWAQDGRMEVSFWRIWENRHGLGRLSHHARACLRAESATGHCARASQSHATYLLSVLRLATVSCPSLPTCPTFFLLLFLPHSAPIPFPATIFASFPLVLPHPDDDRELKGAEQTRVYRTTRRARRRGCTTTERPVSWPLVISHQPVSMPARLQEDSPVGLRVPSFLPF